MGIQLDEVLSDGPPPAIDAGARAVRAWRRVQRRPMAISLKRGTVLLPPQTLRLSLESSAGRDQQGLAGPAAARTALLFGVRDHPSPAVPDSDLQLGDRLVLDGQEFTLTGLIYLPGQVQAWAEVIG